MRRWTLAAAFFFIAMAITTHSFAQGVSEISPAQVEALVAQNKGKVLIVDFFATWCPPCRQEIPGFIALQNKYGAKGLSIVGISVDEGPINVVESFAKEMGINYTVYHGGSTVAGKYRIWAIPTTYIYDKQGNKAKTHIGFASEEEFDKQISGLL